ncbi:MAG: NTP transferase domain-containing protein [Bacteroidaceae bacterium]|nr:NTP transferase domain-containing protein [Bacteroidaceae bacterium]
MNYAIIAAGEGSRLRNEGIATPKPLIPINGEPLIDRLIRIFCDNSAESISIICNEQMTDVAEHIRQLQKNYPLRLLVKSTKSSMHSLYELTLRFPDIGKGKTIVTTVDTFFSEIEFSRYAKNFSRPTFTDVYMGLTPYIDDEKPLYAKTYGRTIVGYYDSPNGCTMVSAGIYGLSPKCIPILHNCVMKGEKRMRNFQRALISKGIRIKPFIFSTVFDIDHICDIEKAKSWK